MKNRTLGWDPRNLAKGAHAIALELNVEHRGLWAIPSPQRPCDKFNVKGSKCERLQSSKCHQALPTKPKRTLRSRFLSSLTDAPMASMACPSAAQAMKARTRRAGGSTWLNTL